jgi:uncharacterized membrane protein YphA (DoxX/SURF4 family)
MTRVSESKLHSTWWVLRFTFGLVPFLAGLDKFFNILTDWTQYLSPIAQRVLPVSSTTFMQGAGVIEMIVGIGILTRWTRVGSYVASFWLVAISANLITTGRYFDVAVRDLVMAAGAFTLASLTEVLNEETSHEPVVRAAKPTDGVRAQA